MNGRTRQTTLSVALVLTVLATASVAIAQQSEADFEAIANRLVNQCAAIQENDLVMISGRPDDMELLENVAIHVRKLGAFPLISVSTDNLTRRMYDEVPAKYDTQSPTLAMKMAEMFDAIIAVSAEENPALLANVPPERIAAHDKTLEPVYNAMLKRNVRQVELGNALYPTPAKARQLGISLNELTTIFWDGVNVDYLKLQAIADTIKARLAVGKTVHITSDSGTDLRVQIERRPINVNDGVISADDVRIGKAACQVWLPAGEVYLAPVPGTAEGTVVIDRHYFHGREIRDLRLTFEDGKLTSMKAKSGLEPLKKLYDVSGTGKDEFAAIDIGINPNVRIPTDSRMVAWMASGMITVGIGTNTWAGGENTCNFALFTHLPNATLTVDEKILVENGVLRP
jgi:leucyl aminopeptidase (aminopeptidase T)